jgi:hypothetical protein
VVGAEKTGETVWDVYHKSIVRGNMKRVNMTLVGRDTVISQFRYAARPFNFPNQGLA